MVLVEAFGLGLEACGFVLGLGKTLVYITHAVNKMLQNYLNVIDVNFRTYLYVMSQMMYCCIADIRVTFCR